MSCSPKCSFPTTAIVSLTVSLKRCCPLLFTLEPNDLLLSNGSGPHQCNRACDHLELNRSQRKGSTFFLYVYKGFRILTNSTPWKCSCKFYSLIFSLPKIPSLSFPIPLIGFVYSLFSFFFHPSVSYQSLLPSESFLNTPLLQTQLKEQDANCNKQFINNWRRQSVKA